jgi:hypothetical protein
MNSMHGQEEASRLLMHTKQTGTDQFPDGLIILPVGTEVLGLVFIRLIQRTNIHSFSEDRLSAYSYPSSE